MIKQLLFCNFSKFGFGCLLLSVLRASWPGRFLRLRISAIVDACFRLIVDGESASPWRRWGGAQELG
jgi:hypothetical protein